MSQDPNKPTELKEVQIRGKRAYPNTDYGVLCWIKSELHDIISKAVKDSSTTNFSVGVLAAIACRETKNIIAANMNKAAMLEISSITRGDFTKRPKDKEKTYHGYSFWQIDIDSFPDFIKSGKWKSPYNACLFAIKVLEGKRKYLKSKFPNLPENGLLRASIAAYNCGEGNVRKVLEMGKDIDIKTAHGNYSKSVLDYKNIYQEFA